MKRNNKGFTLVEILIVVIILGILAAIVIPQFTEASNDARVSAMTSDLQTVRSQVELYKIQHLDVQPGGPDATWDADLFVTQLTTKTNTSGTSDSGAGPVNLGPYLQKFPTNPFDGKSSVVRVAADANGDVTASGDGGWYFDPNRGQFGVNYDGYTDR